MLTNEQYGISEEASALVIRVPKSSIGALTDARSAGEGLEKAIQMLIANFERRTSCPVLKVEPGPPTASGKYSFWKVLIKL